jgi:hypothetical protein
MYRIYGDILKLLGSTSQDKGDQVILNEGYGFRWIVFGYFKNKRNHTIQTSKTFLRIIR